MSFGWIIHFWWIWALGWGICFRIAVWLDPRDDWEDRDPFVQGLFILTVKLSRVFLVLLFLSAACTALLFFVPHFTPLFR